MSTRQRQPTGVTYADAIATLRERTVAAIADPGPEGNRPVAAAITEGSGV